jgi:hypothetical protein
MRHSAGLGHRAACGVFATQLATLALAQATR